MKLLSERDVKLNILSKIDPGRSIRTVHAADGHDYFCVRDFCMALGFLGEHVSYQVTKIRRNQDLSGCYEIFPVATPGGLQQAGFLRDDMLGPWLDGLSSKRDDVGHNITVCRDALARFGLQVDAVDRPGQAVPVFAYIDNGEELVPKFAVEVVPNCAWKLLPFPFLYDLFKGWLRRENAFVRMPSKKAVTDILSGMTETELTSWRVVTAGVRPWGLMDDEEPLLETYKVFGWDDPYARPCTAGLVRIV